MSRTKGSTNESIFQTFKTTHSSLSPIENLMLAVYEQAVTDLTFLLKSGKEQSTRSEISFADIYNFFDKSYYNDYVNVNGKEIYNIAIANLLSEDLINENQLEKMENDAIALGVEADRIALDRYKRLGSKSLTNIEAEDLDNIEIEDELDNRAG